MCLRDSRFHELFPIGRKLRLLNGASMSQHPHNFGKRIKTCWRSESPHHPPSAFSSSVTSTHMIFAQGSNFSPSPLTWPACTAIPQTAQTKSTTPSAFIVPKGLHRPQPAPSTDVAHLIIGGTVPPWFGAFISSASASVSVCMVMGRRTRASWHHAGSASTEGAEPETFTHAGPSLETRSLVGDPETLGWPGAAAVVVWPGDGDGGVSERSRLAQPGERLVDD